MTEKPKVNFKFHKASDESEDLENNDENIENKETVENTPVKEKSTFIDNYNNNENNNENKNTLKKSLFVISLIILISFIYLFTNPIVDGNSINQTIGNETGLNKSDDGIKDDVLILDDDIERVKITEFIDFQCPACKELNDDLKQFEFNFIEAIEIEYVQFPLAQHEFAKQLAEYFICLGDNELAKQEFKSRMFNNQYDFSEELIQKQLDRIDFDKDKFSKCMESPSLQAELFDHSIKAKNVGVNGTPWILVEGEYVEPNVDTIKEKVLSALNQKNITYKFISQAERLRLIKLAEINLKQQLNKRIDVADLKDIDPLISIVVITTDKCFFCDHESVIKNIEDFYFPNIVVEVIDMESDTAKTMISSMNLKHFPAYIFDKAVEKAANFNVFENFLLKTTDFTYILREQYHNYGLRYEWPLYHYYQNEWGNVSSPLRVYNYFNFECEHCKSFYENVELNLDDNYVNKIHFYDRFLVIDEFKNTKITIPAAKCFVKLGGDFSFFKDELFKLQKTLKKESKRAEAYTDKDKQFSYLMNTLIPEMHFVRAKTNITFEDFNTCLNVTLWENDESNILIQNNLSAIMSAPTILINEQVIHGAPQSVDDFQSLINKYILNEVDYKSVIFD